MPEFVLSLNEKDSNRRLQKSENWPESPVVGDRVEVVPKFHFPFREVSSRKFDQYGNLWINFDDIPEEVFEKYIEYAVPEWKLRE